MSLCTKKSYYYIIVYDYLHNIELKTYYVFKYINKYKLNEKCKSYTNI